ncbi:MAG: S9 family peptidase [Chlamydiia bacterium]|nr:S9 family peptidase [Chlamydiia bacterium]
MSRKILLTVLLFAAQNIWANEYPATEQIPHTDHYHGYTVEDPYHWLENGDNGKVQQWDLEQSRFFSNYNNSNPYYSSLLSQMKSCFSETCSATISLGNSDRLLTIYQDINQHAPVLFIQENKNAQFQLLLNINTWNDHPTYTFIEPSPNGRYLALGIQHGGNEKPQLLIVDIPTRALVSDTVIGSNHFHFLWTPDSTAFYYSTVDTPGNFLWTSIYYHTMGTNASSDVKILGDATHNDWMYNLFDDNDLLYIYRSRWDDQARTILECYAMYLADPYTPPTKFFELLGDEISSQLIVINDTEYLLTDHEAPAFQLLKKVDDDAWTAVINESSDILQYVQGIDGCLAATYSSHGHDRIKIFDMNGKFIKEIPLPCHGTAMLDSSWDSSEAYILFSSMIHPDSLYCYDIKKNTLKLEKRTAIQGYDPDDYITHLAFVRSADGTNVPIHIAHHKDYQEGYALLKGYGGFGLPIQPSFEHSNICWLQAGGLICETHLRGGGEYGETWHQGGTRNNKERCFDDFIAAAEHLVQKYTVPNRLAIWGGSNGGLLTGAAVTRRPDLFGAVVSAVPLLDMLRYHHFRLGYLWVGEYGCSDHPDQFPSLFAYSPYHNVVNGTAYPATLITTGLNDLRCDPMHARKMTARLQYADPFGRPHLLNINYNGGHGAHTMLAQCEYVAQEHGFLMQEIAIPLPSNLQKRAGILARQKQFLAQVKEQQRADDYDKQLKKQTRLHRMQEQRAKRHQLSIKKTSPLHALKKSGDNKGSHSPISKPSLRLRNS